MSIYFLGVLATLLIIKLLNKHISDPAPLDAILLLSVLSWAGVVIYIIIALLIAITDRVSDEDIKRIVNKSKKFFDVCD